MKSNTKKMTGWLLGVICVASMANAQGPNAQNNKRREAFSAEEMIRKYDKDGDSKLSADELQVMVTEMKSRRPGRGDNPGGERGGPRMTREDMLKKYDADGDGTLNAEERAKMIEDLKAKRGQVSE